MKRELRERCFQFYSRYLACQNKQRLAGHCWPLWSLAAGGANFIAETLHCPTLRRNTVEASLLVLLALAVINNGMAPVLRLFIRTRVVLKVSLPYAPRAELVEEHITTAVCVHFSKQLLGLLAR